jgi:hypothetical protein
MERRTPVWEVELRWCGVFFKHDEQEEHMTRSKRKDKFTTRNCVPSGFTKRSVTQHNCRYNRFQLALLSSAHSSMP